MFNNGFSDYLQGQGWDGQGPMWQYAQQLRQQGQHPWMDYFRQMRQGMNGPVQGGQMGLGGLQQQAWNGHPAMVSPPGQAQFPGNGGIVPPGYEPPHQMVQPSLMGLMQRPKLGLR